MKLKKYIFKKLWDGLKLDRFLPLFKTHMIMTKKLEKEPKWDGFLKLRQIFTFIQNPHDYDYEKIARKK